MRCAKDIGRWSGVGVGSFCIWQHDTPLRAGNLDPNYLRRKHFASSPFHCALHAFTQKFENKPVLHIDLHGKVNRRGNRNIDMGIKPMIRLFKQPSLVAAMRREFKKKIDAFF